MRPLDPRLLRRAASARRWIALSAGLQAASTAVLVVQSLWLAGAVAGVVDGAAADTVTAPAIGVGAAFAVRALIAGVAERFAHRASVRTIRQLRAAVLDHCQRGGAGTRSPADLTTLSTTGLAHLDAYLVRYLPQLVATALVTPALLVVVVTQDLLSAAIIAGTLPLVPLFMALVGWTTQRLSDDRIARMRRLGDQVLDLVAGLATLQALGRALPQARRVREVGEAYRVSTQRVLQIAFLSGLVLEVLTTICVALVAVGIGMRLVFGQLDLSVGLAVLILAPEVYLPLRMVGLHFHASSDGIAAAAAALELIDEPLPADRAGVRPGTVLGVGWRDVRVDQPGRGLAAPVGLTATATAGRVLALAGPNGGGKSTAVRALLGLVDPTEGRVVLQVGDGEVDVAEVDPGWWHARVAWVPQHPTIVAATLADNIELLVPGLHTAERDLAAARAGLAQVVAQLPDGWATRVGEGGVGLSAGQRQRLALTRAAAKVHAGAQVVILDEPSAHLDAGTEALVVRTVQEWAERGLVVIVVAHRAGLLAIADQVVEVSASPTCGADR